MFCLEEAQSKLCSFAIIPGPQKVSAGVVLYDTTRAEVFRAK